MSRKTVEKPGQITACKQVKSRVINNVSPSDRITLSETGRGVMDRTRKNQPDNEGEIRGYEMNKYGIQVLEDLYGPEIVRESLFLGVFVVKA